MKRIFLWTDTVIPIADFDFRVTIVALQAVRGLIIEKRGWPDHLGLENRILVRFLDLPIVPMFLRENDDFVLYESRYQTRIKELTGHTSLTKHFEPQGKTFRDFAEHRLGTTLEFALFYCLMDIHNAGRAHIPSFNGADNFAEVLKRNITEEDMKGLDDAMNLILNPLLEIQGNKIVQMNPPIDKEFPNIAMIKDSSSIGRTFADIVSDALYYVPTRDAAPA